MENKFNPASFQRPPPYQMNGYPGMNPQVNENMEDRACLFQFKCSCKTEIKLQADLKEHYFECKEMKYLYGDLFQTVVDYNKKTLTLQEKKNLNSVLHMLSQEIEQSIVNEEKDKKPIEKMQPMPNNIRFDQSPNNYDKLPPVNEKYYPDVDMKPAFDEAEYMKQIVDLQNYETCNFCKKHITPKEESEGKIAMLQSDDCYHLIHRHCFKLLSFQAVNQAQPIKCPKCKIPVQEIEVRDILGQKDYEDLQKQIQLQLLAQNQNLVNCSCGNVMEVEQGKVDRNQKDDQGKPISEESAIHMSKYRVRCGSCQKNFCCKCQCEPYHLGKTCEQFKEFKEARKCRFCLTKLTQSPPSMNPAFKEVCRQSACIDLMGKSCDKILGCGHPCCGFKDEKQCLPCISEECVKKNEAATNGVNGESFCSICYTEGLAQGPCVQLKCSHIFHLECILSKVNKKWPGPRIVFGFLDCPGCKGRISAPHCPLLDKETQESEEIEKEVLKKAVERAKFENLDKDPRLKDPNDQYYNNMQKFAMFKLAYYQCFKCKSAYFGGMKDCLQAQQEGQQYKPEELVCGKCAAVSVGAGVQNCAKHGQEFIEFKCKFCCSIAQWFCWGTTHFCEVCHKKQVDQDYVSRKQKHELPQCKGPDQCPLKVKHPENGEEYALGCAICRNQVANQKDF